MRRAILSITLLASTFALFPAIARSQQSQLMNGIGLIDYNPPPHFKVGTWAKYHVTGHSILGHSDDYVVTIGIAGEERLWGEDCFWVETSTESRKGGSTSIATLMSYSVFDDSLPFTHMQYYIRKNVTESDELGNPVEVISRRPPVTLKARAGPERKLSWHIDTLGVDTIHIDKGTFVCKHVRTRQDLGIEAGRGDSSLYSETMDHRESFVSRLVPLTGIVREDIDFTSTLKAWMIGRSRDAPTNTVSHAVGQAVLVDYGENYQPTVIAPFRRHSLRELDREAARGAPAAPRRRAPGRKSG
jgi:hypothetical protein